MSRLDESQLLGPPPTKKAARLNKQQVGSVIVCGDQMFKSLICCYHSWIQLVLCVLMVMVLLVHVVLVEGFH